MCEEWLFRNWGKVSLTHVSDGYCVVFTAMWPSQFLDYGKPRKTERLGLYNRKGSWVQLSTPVLVAFSTLVLNGYNNLVPVTLQLIWLACIAMFLVIEEWAPGCIWKTWTYTFLCFCPVSYFLDPLSLLHNGPQYTNGNGMMVMCGYE